MIGGSRGRSFGQDPVGVKLLSAEDAWTRSRTCVPILDQAPQEAWAGLPAHAPADQTLGAGNTPLARSKAGGSNQPEGQPLPRKRAGDGANGSGRPASARVPVDHRGFGAGSDWHTARSRCLGFKSNPFLFELAFGPFMAVEVKAI